MPKRLGLGPVFAYEWLLTSRRWQVYAARSLFVAMLLASLAMVWYSNDSFHSRSTLQGQAEVGQYFYQAIVGTQLVLLLLAAPAATAGSVCLDKARGTLTHLLVTDLSNSEIVLGKLAARLVPVFGLVACALPAMALGTLLGGIDPKALTGAFLVSLGVAAIGCSLALMLSVWGTKTNEVLMVTYAILVVWVLAGPTLDFAVMLGWGSGAPEWLNYTNPFWHAFATAWQRGSVDLGQDLLFLASTWGISAAMTAMAVFRLRAVASRQAGRSPGRRRGGIASSARVRALREWLGPRLDPNPVLWREWHRHRPSRWSRILWGVYAGSAILVSAFMIQFVYWNNRPQSEMCSLFVGGQVAIGFLLLSIASATSLSEERVRGSLDILLATPMATRSIVLGKWWGAFRGTLLLSFLPALVTVAIAVRNGRWLGLILVPGLILTFGAALTSLGLALATWIPRQGRVMALTVAAYVLVTIGWIFVAVVLTQGQNGIAGPGFASASPLMGTTVPLILMQQTIQPNNQEWGEYIPWMILWIVIETIVALGLLAATLATFDRCLGRVSTHPFAAPIRPTPKPKPRVDPIAVME